MRQQNFIGPAYELASPNLDIQNCKNFLLTRHELGGGKNAEVFHFLSRPKLTKLGSLGAGPTRGGFNASNNRAFVVSANTFYEVVAPATATIYGTLNTSSGRVCMADNGNQLMLVDGVDGYVFNFATGAFTTITDPDFPENPTHCAFIDNYILVVNGETGEFFFSAISDAQDWDGLDFATAEGYPDLTTALAVDHRNVVLFGEQTIELWENDGVTPFSRIANGFIEHGIAAPQAVCKIDNTLFWVGKDANGQGIVWRLGDGFSIDRISTFALEYAIAQYGDISTATAFSLQYGGHSLLLLNFPNSNTTWVYDLTTKSWSEWNYTKPAGGLGRFRGEWHVFVSSGGVTTHLCGDYENGNLYELQDPYIHKDTAYTDDGASITRERTAPHISNEGKRITISEATIDVETGIGRATGGEDAVDPQLMFQYSKNSHTWSSWRTKSLGKQGEYTTRVVFRRMGICRDFVGRVRITSPVPVTLISAFGEPKGSRT